MESLPGRKRVGECADEILQVRIRISGDDESGGGIYARGRMILRVSLWLSFCFGVSAFAAFGDKS